MICRVQEDGEVPVLIHDRWTARGSRTPGSPPTRRYSRICSVSRSTIHRCCDRRLWASSPGCATEKVVLLSIDPLGQAVTVKNDPAC